MAFFLAINPRDRYDNPDLQFPIHWLLVQYVSIIQVYESHQLRPHNLHIQQRLFDLSLLKPNYK